MQIDLVWICYTCAKFDVAHRNRNMSLYDDLTRIARQVESQLRQMKNNETATINVSVMPFIRALGYNTQDLSEVYPEYAILNMDAVDLAILREGEPIIFLEAKKASERLSTKHWKQLFEYFNADKARIGILTNGIEYRFYTDSAKQNIMDNEPFLTINLRDLDKVSVAHLDGFTKERFHPEHSLRKIKTSKLLRHELKQPSDEFVKYFARQVHSGAIWQSVIEEFRPLLKHAWDELIEQEISRRLQRHEAKEEGLAELPLESEIEKPDPPVNPGDSKYIPIFGYYEGHRFEAELLRKSINDGLTIAGNQIRFNGKTTWLKNAAVIAIRSVDPSFEPTRTYPNGFEFWYVVDPADGKEHMIRYISGWDNMDEALRQRVLSS